MKYTLIIVISLFVYMLYMKNIEKMKENFINNIKKKKIEHFSEIPGIRDMPDGNENKELENSKEAGLDENEKIDNNTKNDNIDNNEKTDNNEKNELENELNKKTCSHNKDDGKCLFGCPDSDVTDVIPTKPPSVSRETNMEEMMKTIEETEKICNLIEEKDKKRKEQEEKETLKKQIELNKKFLIQQKAQNKQIEDLEKIVKEMRFTEKMNETAVEKCGVGADECLSNKEKKLINLLKQKQAQKKNVKVNFNLDNFGEKFVEQISQQLNLTGGEMGNLFKALKDGTIDVNQLRNQILNANSNSNYNYNSLYGSGSDSVSGKSNTSVKSNGSSEYDCPECKIDLSQYIDRCKIPCNKCRDPSWNCPQDVRN